MSVTGSMDRLCVSMSIVLFTFISRICWAKSPGRIDHKCFLEKDIPDIITFFKFGDDRLRGLASAEGQILQFSIARSHGSVSVMRRSVLTNVAVVHVVIIVYKCTKITILKLTVRTMRRYHSTKTAKIFWVTLDVAMHGAAYGLPMRSPI